MGNELTQRGDIHAHVARSGPYFGSLHDDGYDPFTVTVVVVLASRFFLLLLLLLPVSCLDVAGVFLLCHLLDGVRPEGGQARD